MGALEEAERKESLRILAAERANVVQLEEEHKQLLHKEKHKQLHVERLSSPGGSSRGAAVGARGAV